jgi:hypothetical protein
MDLDDPEEPTACANEAVNRPPTMSATLSPFFRPMNAMTSGTFHAGSSGGGAPDCEDAGAAAAIDKANMRKSARFRMSQFLVVKRSAI